MDCILAVTYRCNSRCVMCHTWRHPSRKEDEITAKDLETLPSLVRLNLTGGEPFLREDVSEILHVLKRRAKRVVVSTNGFLTKRILRVMREHPDVGVRVSIDGMGPLHDKIRGVGKAHTMAWATLFGLRELGIKDLGIAVTVSDENAGELVSLQRTAREYGVELATAIVHNAYYFHKEDNEIVDKSRVARGLKDLVDEYMASHSPKDWFRAYFTAGMIDHVYCRQPEFKCTAATGSFFMDPYGDIRPCNVMDLPFGNIKKATFEEIWQGPGADGARRRVATCDCNCWMICSVGHQMRRRFWVPLRWIARKRLAALAPRA